MSATLSLTGASSIGNAFTTIIGAADIQPGDDPSYEICKLLYLYHPMGAKMVEKPLKIAQSQPRKISIPDAPEDRVKEQFLKTWKRVGVDKHIFRVASQSRTYGIASVGCMVEGQQPNTALDLKTLWKEKYAFNVYDPLNTAGSLVLNQDPLAMDFQHAQEIRVNNATFHRSRTCIIINEFPIYISYTPATFGFTGRSVFQRSLYPLKSFIQTMRTDDMVSVKAGVIVSKIKQAGAMITDAMFQMFGIKRNVVKEAVVGQVISIGTEGEEIESIDLKNLEAPFKQARDDIIENIASGASMPAQMLTEESFVEGFGEGTEDAKAQARFVQDIREWMEPLYDYFTKITMHLAWTPEFYETIQKEFKADYGKLTFEAAFYRWENSFKAEWPNLLEEPDSEKVKVDDVKLRALIAVLQVYMPLMDPENLIILAQFVADNINEMRLLFGSPLNFEYDKLKEHAQNEQDRKELSAAAAMDKGGDEEGEGDFETGDNKFKLSKADSVEKGILALQAAVDRLRNVKQDRKLRVIEGRKRA